MALVWLPLLRGIPVLDVVMCLAPMLLLLQSLTAAALELNLTMANHICHV
jgi:hypothetical protein